MTPHPSEVKKTSRFDPVSLGVFYAFVASASYGLGTVVARKAVTEASPFITALVALVAGIATLAAVSARTAPKDLKAASKRTYLNLVLAGMLALFGLILFYVALSLAPVAVVAPVSSLIPLFSLVFSHFFLQKLERITPKIIIGTVLVVIGVVLVSLNSVLGS